MKERTTQADLDRKLALVNRMAGSFLVLDKMGSGWRLETSNGAGQFGPRQSKAEMGRWLDAMACGIELQHACRGVKREAWETRQGDYPEPIADEGVPR